MIPGFNDTPATTIRELTARWRRGFEDGILKSGLWQTEEHACALGAAGPDVENANHPCLAFIGPRWMRQLIVNCFDGVADDVRTAAFLDLADALDLWSDRPDYLDTAERLLHRFASEHVLPLALTTFNHAIWPEIARVITDKIDLHQRWLAGDFPTSDQWSAVEKWAAGAVAAAGDKRAAWITLLRGFTAIVREEAV